MVLGVAALFVVAPLLPGPARAQDPFEIWTDATVLGALNRAEQALEEELGSRPAKRPRVLLSSREFFEGISYKAIERIAGKRGPEDERAIAAQAKVLARSAFGYYEFGKNTVHLLPENFHAFARNRNRPAFLGEEFLTIVLAHELTHAWDSQRWTTLARAEQTKDEEYKIWYPLIEGHAMWVTKRVSTRLGLSKEYQSFVDASFNPPPCSRRPPPRGRSRTS